MSKLPVQPDLRSVDQIVDVHSLHGVFPVFRMPQVEERKVSVYVDKNYRKIFEFLKYQSGWSNTTDKDPNLSPRSAQVCGPPGSGKI